MGFLTDGLTFNTLRNANIERGKTAKKFNKAEKWIPAQWVTALVGELGEAANILKKVDRGDYTLDEVKSDIADELADVQCYLDRLADKLGINLGEATMKKFNEVSRRVESPIYIDADGYHTRDAK